MVTAILLVLLICTFVYITSILYFKIGWSRTPYFNASSIIPNTKLSVIIPVRNESKHIQACIESVLHQSYPKHLYEIIVVDDFSTDDTVSIVKKYSEVKLISLQDFVLDKINSYKKKAIEIAIQHSSGEVIVTTDGDCTVKENWLQTIASFYESTQANFIAMPVLIDQTSANIVSFFTRLLQRFQSLDFMTLQGITGAAVSSKSMSMCNGANMAYTKKAFFAVDGFKGIDAIASGDDMLLMHKISKQEPSKVFFLKSKDVIVQTQPVSSIGEFMNQRIRWASKADKYDDKRIIAVLAMVYLFNVILLVLPILIFLFNIQYTIYNLSIIEIFVLVLVLKTIVELFFLASVASFFDRLKWLIWFPFLQPFHIVYTVVAGWLGKFGQYQWKGRTVK